MNMRERLGTLFKAPGVSVQAKSSNNNNSNTSDNNNSFITDVDAIDNLSSLLIDISASIVRHDLTELKPENDAENTLNVIEKLKSIDLVKINQALNGFKHNTDFVAPTFKPSSKETKAIFNLISKNKQLPKSVFDSITKNKARTTNFQNFILNGKIEISNAPLFEMQTKEFLYDLQNGISILDNIFNKVGLNKTEKELFYNFVSRTASTLFYLGFADSINHAVHVARKCAIEAYREKMSNHEILQSAMVGWIHDPKVPGNFSWSNLSTHPIIASAIALEVLTQKDLQKQIEKYLNQFKLFEKNKMNLEYFIKGIVEAVAINNDSKFVLDNAIFTRPSWAPGLPETGGVIDQIAKMTGNELLSIGCKFDSQDLIKDITKIALDRFYSPSNMTKPAAFDNCMIKVLKAIQVDTGLVGIKLQELRDACLHLSEKYPYIQTQSALKVFEQILNGELQNQEFISELSSFLQKVHMYNHNTFYNIKVSADKLFSHHDEMKYAPFAAVSLAIADRLLLSPHKILEAGVQNTTLGRIKSFMDSFEDNIRTLPKLAQKGGKIFQRDLYVSILKTADELTGQHNFEKYKTLLISTPEKYHPYKSDALKELDLRRIEVQVEYLEYLIRNEKSWINEANGTNFANINPTDKEQKNYYDVLLNKIRSHYDESIEKSPEMFGFVKIEKQSFISKITSKL